MAKRKATKQEVFDEIENIIKRAKKDELDLGDLKLLRGKIDHHILSVERKMEADWLDFEFGFYIEAETDTRDILEFEVRKLQILTKLNIDYLNDGLKISGNRLSFEPKDRAYIIQSLTYTISNFGRLDANPSKEDIIMKAVTTFLN